MGRRIGGGTAHAFYVGPGDEARRYCLIPRGKKKARRRTRRPHIQPHARAAGSVSVIHIHFGSRRLSGEIVRVGDDLHPLPPIHTILKDAEGEDRTGSGASARHSDGNRNARTVVRVGSSKRTMAARIRAARRGSRQAETVIESMPPRFAEARRRSNRSTAGNRRPERRSDEGQTALAQLSSKPWDRASSGGCRYCVNCGGRCTREPAGGDVPPTTSGFGFSSRDTRCVRALVIRSMNGDPSRRRRCSARASRSSGKAGLDRVLDHVASHCRRHERSPPMEIWNYLRPHLERRFAPEIRRSNNRS